MTVNSLVSIYKVKHGLFQIILTYFKDTMHCLNTVNLHCTVLVVRTPSTVWSQRVWLWLQWRDGMSPRTSGIHEEGWLSRTRTRSWTSTCGCLWPAGLCLAPQLVAKMCSDPLPETCGSGDPPGHANLPDSWHRCKKLELLNRRRIEVPFDLTQTTLRSCLAV